MDMKKIFLLIIIIVFLVPAALTAKIETDITRANFWIDLDFKSKFHESGIGIAARFNTRYNFNYLEENNGSQTDTDPERAYLQDLYFGLMWTKVFIKKLTFVISPQYRLEAWYADNAKSGSSTQDYNRHSIYWPFLIKYDFGKVILKYQLCFWTPFKAKKMNQDDQFFIKNLIGVIIPINKLIDVFIEDEVYVLTTADDRKKQDPFYRNALRAGVIIKPLDFLSVKVAYVNHYTHSTLYRNSSTTKIQQFDHYIYVGALFYVDTTGNSETEAATEKETKTEK